MNKITHYAAKQMAKATQRLRHAMRLFCNI